MGDVGASPSLEGVDDIVGLYQQLFDPLRCLWPPAAPFPPSPSILPPHTRQNFGVSPTSPSMPRLTQGMLPGRGHTDVGAN